MCTLCDKFQPYLETCGYEGLSAKSDITDLARVVEGSDAPSGRSTPYEVAPGDIFAGYLGEGDQDWIAIGLEAGQTVEIALDGVGSGALEDPLVRLYDASGRQVASNDDGGPGLDSLLAFTAGAAGTYYIVADSYHSSGSRSEGDYEITIRAADAPSPSGVGTLDELAAFLTDGYWNADGRSRHAFDTRESNIVTVDITGLDADGQRLARMALEGWETVADLSFREVRAGADIEFNDDDDGAYATYSAFGGVTDSAFVNVSADWLDIYGSTIDSYSFQTYLHEIGHALGLGHQGQYNGAARYGFDETFANDSWQLSVMSYFDQTDNSTVDASFANLATVMAADILAIQDLYGAPRTDSATGGNTIYGANSGLGTYLGDLFGAVASGATGRLYDGGALAFTLYDRGGYDRIDLSFDGSDQRLDLRAEAISDIAGGTGNLVIARGTVIERAITGAGDDTVQGNGAANRLDGRGGADDLRGGAGDDRLFGGAGDDVLRAGGGHDMGFGGAGRDRLIGRNGADTLDGGAGDDMLAGNNGEDRLRGRAGDDVLQGGGGGDTLLGESGDDRLTGGAGMDALDGHNGNDRLTGNAGLDTLRGGDGRDLILGGINDDLMVGGAGRDTLKGGNGGDRLRGDGGDDVLLGNAGTDILNGGAGNDALSGGIGADQFNFTSGGGRDTIVDFQDDIDRLALDADLWGGRTLSTGQILAMAELRTGDLVFDFGGGDVLKINNMTEANALADDLVVI